MHALIIALGLAGWNLFAAAACVTPPAASSLREEAFAQVRSLPEVRELLKSSSVPLTFHVSDALEEQDAKCYWSIAIYENHKTHWHARYFFLAGGPRGELLAQEPTTGEFVPLKRWREMRMGRGGAS